MGREGRSVERENSEPERGIERGVSPLGGVGGTDRARRQRSRRRGGALEADRGSAAIWSAAVVNQSWREVGVRPDAGIRWRQAQIRARRRSSPLGVAEARQVAGRKSTAELCWGHRPDLAWSTHDAVEVVMVEAEWWWRSCLGGARGGAVRWTRWWRWRGSGDGGGSGLLRCSQCG